MAVPALCLPQPHTHPKECMGNMCTPHHYEREWSYKCSIPPLRRQDPTSRGRRTQDFSELKGKLNWESSRVYLKGSVKFSTVSTFIIFLSVFNSLFPI